MAPGWMQILIVVVLIVLLFGRGKISDLMGDVAKGIKSFKKGMSDDGDREHRREPPRSLDHDRPVPPADPAKEPENQRTHSV